MQTTDIPRAIPYMTSKLKGHNYAGCRYAVASASAEALASGCVTDVVFSRVFRRVTRLSFFVDFDYFFFVTVFYQQ